MERRGVVHRLENWSSPCRPDSWSERGSFLGSDVAHIPRFPRSLISVARRLVIDDP